MVRFGSCCPSYALYGREIRVCYGSSFAVVAACLFRMVNRHGGGGSEYISERRKRTRRDPGITSVMLELARVGAVLEYRGQKVRIGAGEA